VIQKAVICPRVGEAGPVGYRASPRIRSMTPPSLGQAPVQAMGMSDRSKSPASRLCIKTDDKVQTILNRPLAGDWLDATYVKVSQAGRIVSVSSSSRAPSTTMTDAKSSAWTPELPKPRPRQFGRQVGSQVRFS
jgi:hypothetical protein